MSTITFTCPHCQSQMNFASTAVGQQGKCSGCQQIVTIQGDPPPIAANPADKKKIIIFAIVSCGGLMVLGLALVSIPFLILWSANKNTLVEGQLTDQTVESNNEPAGTRTANPSDPPRSIKTPKYIALQKQLGQAMDYGEITQQQYGDAMKRAHTRLKLEGETPGEYYRRQLMFLLDHGTPQEKNDTASLVNAIEMARQRGLNAVPPDMRREVSQWLPLVTQD